MPSARPSQQQHSREADRVLRRLKLLVHLSKPTQREIERLAGLSRGHLSQILNGNVELKLRHLFEVLDALEIEPREFFVQIYPRRRFDAFRALERLLRQGSQAGDRHLRLELARLYGFGIETVLHLRQRLEACENALHQLEALGILQSAADGHNPTDVRGRS